MKRKDVEVHEDFESDISINAAINHIAMSYKDGQVLVKSLEDPSKLLFALTDASKSCEWVEYSPNSEKLACGSHDKKIYIYQCDRLKYDLIKTYEFHSGGIIAIDWCVNSKFLRSNCDSNELIYWKISQKKYLSPEQATDIQWNSQNCKLSWNTQGVIPYGASPDLVNCCATEETLDIIATGDDNGRVNIYNNPCLPDYNKGRMYRGHAGHIGRIDFSPGGEYMFSVGGYDHTVIQWKKVHD